MLCNLSDLTLRERQEFGPKASTLGQLIRHGFRVPSGFALSIKAFETFLSYNGFPYNPADYLGNHWEIQKFIVNSAFPPELESQLEKYFKKLLSLASDGTFAVRSSGLGEDSDLQSMAGMFESYLDLKTMAEVKTAILKCYASLFHEKVLGALFEKAACACVGSGFENLKMAVIVQCFTPGNVSGVCFTVDTVNMDPLAMHLNAVNGICAGLVSGQASSSLYRLRKADGTPLDSQIPENTPDLSGAEMKELYRQSLAIEAALGAPQDIEWTLADGKMYILQARPITTFREKNFQIRWPSPGDADYTWRRGPNIPFPPIMQDFELRKLPISNQGAYWAAYENGYIDITFQNGYFYARKKAFPNLDKKQTQLKEHLETLEGQGLNLFCDVMLPPLLELMKSMEGFLWNEELSLNEAHEFFDLFLTFSDQAEHWSAVQGRKYRRIFEAYCRDIYSELTVQDFYDLIFQPSTLTRERERGLQMAALVQSEKSLRNLFASCPYNPIVYARLLKMPEAKQLLSLIKESIRESPCDSPLAPFLQPTVLERPDYVLSLIRSLLDVDPNVFYASLQRTRENKERLIALFLSKIGKEREVEFLRKLHLAEKAFLTGDDHHFYIERRKRGYFRLAAMAAGKVLTQEKLLQNPEDIHYLTLAEIQDALKHRSPCQQLVQARQELYRGQRKLLPPSYLGKNPEERTVDDASAASPGLILKGVSGLQKRVTGIIHPGIPYTLDEDRILLLDDGHHEFLHLINHVKGLIFEMGSPFDHAGILARELDIPAIYYVKNACNRLNKGDLVELDGINGQIVIIEKKIP